MKNVSDAYGSYQMFKEDLLLSRYSSSEFSSSELSVSIFELVAFLFELILSFSECFNTHATVPHAATWLMVYRAPQVMFYVA